MRAAAYDIAVNRMNIANLKRWQWCIIGLLLGSALGYFWSSPEMLESGALKLSQVEFEANLLSKDPKSNGPILTDIVVQPPVVDYQGKTIDIVTFKALRRGATSGKTFRVPAQFLAVEPYKPLARNVVADELKSGQPLTVTQFIAAARKRNDQLNLKFGWWNERPAAIGLWAASGLVVIGGIWPTIIGLLISGGLGPHGKSADEKSNEAYLGQFGRGGSESANISGNAPLSTELQRAELDKLNAKLEQSLNAGGMKTGDIDAKVEAPESGNNLIAAAAQVRELDGGALKTPKTGIEEAEELEVKGEFYPVIIHHKKGK